MYLTIGLIVFNPTSIDILENSVYETSAWEKLV